MRIDIYSKYKVRFLSSGAYISQEDSTPGDYSFSHYEDDKEEIIDGGKLLDIIKYRLENNYLQEISIKDNTIRIETFNYNNGESDKFTIVVDRIDEKENKKIEKLKIYDNPIEWCCNGRAINDTEKDIIDKLNEIIDNINGE